MPEPVSAKPVPKLRAKSANKPPGRPRPKTIHVDQDADVGSALGSRGPRGSISNISGELLCSLLGLRSKQTILQIHYHFHEKNHTKLALIGVQ